MTISRDYLLFSSPSCDLDFLFKKKEMDKFSELWAAGYDILDIADEMKRDELEIALLIMDLDYQGLIQRRTRGIFGGKLIGEEQGEQSMKNGKKPTVAQCRFMESQGLNSKTWLVAKDTPAEMVCVSRNAKGKPKRNQIKTLAK